MRYQSGHAEVHAEGFGPTVGFGIATSGKAFKGLIDGIYSRKIEAPMRELATNAEDAHKAAGIIRPFDIHLPTVLQPTFWIRDYGPGMSHEFMTTRFNIMFDSTKDGLNSADTSVDPDDQVGCLGLGRMAFFAYTDACTYTVWQDGVARLYAVYMGPDGRPVVAPAGEAPSEEPNGTKVEFAAKKRDRDSFKAAAIRVFKGFHIQPAGLPSDVREAIAEAPLEMGNCWKAYPKTYLPEGGFYARQGCVLYPIDLVQIDDKAIETDDEDDEDAPPVVQLSENFARFKGVDMTVVLDFPIGSLEFDLSRERLAYTDSTVRSLRNRWAEFTADLDAVIEQAFVSKANAFERMLTTREGAFAKLGPLFAQNRFMFEADRIEKAILGLIPDTKNQFYRKHAFVRIIKRSPEPLTGLLPSWTVYHGTKTYDGPKSHWCRDALYIFRDEKVRHADQRINHLLHKSGKKYAFLIEKGHFSLRKWREIGCPPVIRASALPPLPKAEAEKLEREASTNRGYFERTKVIDGNAYRAPTPEDDLSDHLYGFIHRGFLHNPDPSRYPDLSITDVMALHHLSLATGGPAISFINIRSNDNMDRWADLPLFYDMLFDFASRFDKRQIGEMVRLINHERFTGCWYDDAITLTLPAERKERNPLNDLRRRFKADRKSLDRSICDHFGVLLYAHCDTASPIGKIISDVIAIAVVMGMEVLDPQNANEKFSKPLLSPSWEKYTHHLHGFTRHSPQFVRDSPLYRRLLKESLTC